MASISQVLDMFKEARNEPRRWLTRRNVDVTRKTGYFTLHASECAGASTTTPEVFLLRRGSEDSCNHKLTVFDRDDNGDIMFIMPSAPQRVVSAGRYAALVVQDCKICNMFELTLHEPCGFDGVGDVADTAVVKINNGKLGDMTTIFDGLNTFEAKTTAPVERDAVVINLSAADTETLCAAVLCRPVQFVLFDGIRSEIVEFKGCEDGKVVVKRGAAGSIPYKFAARATLSFTWTPDNVDAACEGCV